MKMKKSQLKDAVKAVVRECLNERLTKEGCGGGKGHLSGGKKGERMFKHIKQGYKGEKSPEDAERIAAATVNKNLEQNEQVGADVVADENMGADSKQTPMDDIVKFVIARVPSIANNPNKVAKVAGELWKHQYGGQAADPDTLMTTVQKHMTAGEEQEECSKMEEAGLTSEDGEKHAYDEKEEIMLIKVMALIAKKLEAMHAGDLDAEEPVGMTIDADEEPSIPSAFGGSEGEPEEKPEPEEPAEPKDDEDGDEEETPVKEAAYKQVAPRMATDAKEDKARRIQTEPKVNETAVKMKMGPQYKTQSPRQARVQSDDQARTIQFDPKMTEVKKKMKENHRVQARSYVTVKDNPNDPNVMRDPENPQSNGA